MSIALPGAHEPSRIQWPQRSVLQELRRVTPDAFQSINIDVGDDAVPNALWKRQRKKRRDLYSNVRIAIGEDGLGHVSLRSIAKRCDLSPQTVYNLVGNRDTMIAASISEHQNAMIASARALDCSYPSFAIAYADVLWSSAMINSGYIRNLTTAYYNSLTHVEQTIRGEVLTGILHALDGPDLAAKLRPNVEAKWLARSVFNIAAASARTWAEDFTDLEDLRRDLVSGLAMLVLGAFKASAAAPIEAWLESSPLR